MTPESLAHQLHTSIKEFLRAPLLQRVTLLRGEVVESFRRQAQIEQRLARLEQRLTRIEKGIR